MMHSTAHPCPAARKQQGEKCLHTAPDESCVYKQGLFVACGAATCHTIPPACWQAACEQHTCAAYTLLLPRRPLLLPNSPPRAPCFSRAGNSCAALRQLGKLPHAATRVKETSHNLHNPMTHAHTQPAAAASLGRAKSVTPSSFVLNRPPRLKPQPRPYVGKNPSPRTPNPASKKGNPTVSPGTQHTCHQSNNQQ